MLTWQLGMFACIAACCFAHSNYIACFTQLCSAAAAALATLQKIEQEACILLQAVALANSCVQHGMLQPLTWGSRRA